jgi:hypothetical protein
MGRYSIRFLLREDADDSLVAALALKLDYAGDFGEQGVVLPDANVPTWVDLCSALPRYDSASRYGFSAIRFNAESLSVRVTAIAGAAHALLMSHLS